jgi:hypothetical protein
LPLDQVVARIDKTKAAAILGGFKDERVMLSGLLEHIEGLPEILKANRYKSNDQRRKWRNPRRRAIENFRAALAWKKRPDDLAVEDISHEHARIHQAWWSERLRQEDLSIDTPNREYVTMSGMLTAYYDGAAKQSPKPYSGISHRDRFKELTSKPEFTVEWISENVITPGALDRMSDEGADITILIAETGCRQSEIYNTPPWDWHLDEAIPYFLIQPINEDGDDPAYRREIKNIHSKRAVPLVGAALEAARRRQGRFPKYGRKSTYSAAANKWFRENKKFPSENHTIGGLRHSWESRMKAVGIDKEDRGELMGHSRKRTRGREVYGDAIELELRHTISMLVALHPSGTGRLVEGKERRDLASRLKKLLKQWKEQG